MSNITHVFEINQKESEHYIISASPNLIITTKGGMLADGETNTYMTSKWGYYNHATGFYSGRDTIKVPLEVIKELNPSTTITKGRLPAAKFYTDGMSADCICYSEGSLFYSTESDSSGRTVELLIMDDSPTVAAADILVI